jgi:hypothetical protein
MTLDAERRAIEATLDEYRARLDSIADEQFDATPPAGGWSYAEVYSHIMQATLGSTIALEKCTTSACLPTTKGRNLIGRLVFTLNTIPIRFKMTPMMAQKNPPKKINKEEARNLIVKCRKRINDVFGLIHDFSPHKRIKHPRFGMLNARHWFKFILIHLNHHIKQLNRIEKNLRSA